MNTETVCYLLYKLNVMLCVFSDYYLIICVYVYLIISKKKIADRWVALSIPRSVVYHVGGPAARGRYRVRCPTLS